MGGTLNHVTPDDLNSWMRNVERRLLTQERRSPQFVVTQQLGPGMGKYAKQVFDWNTENTWQVGQYWSDAGSFNSPNTLIAWIGFTRSAAGKGGVQELFALDGSLNQWRRTFTFTPDGIPVFAAWTTALPGAASQFGGLAATFVGPYDTGVPGPTSGYAFVTPAGHLRAIVNGTAFTTNGGTFPPIVRVYVDGNLLGDMRLNIATSTSVHMALSSYVIDLTVTAATHYLALQLISGNSDGGDVASVVGTVIPA